MPAHHPRLTIAGPLLRGSGQLHIVGSREVVTLADPDGVLLRMVGLADGSRSRGEIVAELTGEFERLSVRDAEDALDELESGGLLEDRDPVGRLFGGRAPWSAGHDRAQLGGPLYA